MQKEFAVGIDISGTHVKVGKVNIHGELSDFAFYPSREWIDSGSLVDNLIQILKPFETENNIGFGFGLPSILNPVKQTPVIINSKPLLNGIDLKNTVASAFPHRNIIFENDANVTAYGEYLFGHKKEVDSFALITLGSDIKCGMVLNGKIFRRMDGNTLEIGDMIIRSGRKLFDLIGSDAVIRLISEKFIETNCNSSIVDRGGISIENLIYSAKHDDLFSQDILIDQGVFLADAICNLLLFFDISHVAIGGVFSEGFDYINKGIQQGLNRRKLKYNTDKVHITKASYSNWSGVMGAAALCF
jgi:glucokinase